MLNIQWSFVVLTLLVCGPLVPHAPSWASLISLVMIIFKSIELVLNKNLIPKLLFKIITILSLIFTLIHYKTLLGYEPASTFLMIISALKLKESYSVRDFRIHLLFMIFLSLILSLFYQSLFMTFLILFNFIFIFYLMLDLSKAQVKMEWRLGKMRRILQFLVLGLPVVILLFLVFPRFEGGWLSLPKMTGGQVGFDNELDPTGIARLVENENVAFRVHINQFSGRIPDDLYWKGSILSSTNGIKWKALALDQVVLGKEDQSYQIIDDYEISLIPHDFKNIFVLEGASEVQYVSGQNYFLKKLTGGVFESNHEITKPISYRAIKYQQIESNQSESYGSDHLTYINRDNQLIRPWVEKMRKNFSSDRDFINHILKKFEMEFTYSQSPGTYSTNKFLDEFMFGRKKGFCGHFSSALALMARLAGIPSRIVVGYQGGEYNEISGQWVVRQKHAHAWTEIYFKNTGWERVDPTIYLNSDRIGQGEYLSEQERLFRSTFLGKIMSQMGHTFDFIQAEYESFMVKFDSNYQKLILGQLLKMTLNWPKVLMVFLSVLISIFVIIFLSYWLMNLSYFSPMEDQLNKAYDELKAKIRLLGVEFKEWDGPHRIVQKIIHQHVKSSEVTDLLLFYAQLRYQRRSCSKKDVKNFQHKVLHLKVKRS